MRTSICYPALHAPPGQVSQDDVWQLTGSKIWVVDGMEASDLLWLARIEDAEAGFGLFTLEAQSPGVIRSPQTTWDGADTFVRIDAEGVTARLLLRADDAGQLLQQITPAGELWAAWGSVAGAQISVLSDAVKASEEEALALRLSELEIDLQGLQAMEQRCVQAQQSGEAQPIPPAALRLRGQQLLLAIGRLQIDALGYYALPFPDQLLAHNEGPVGPVGAEQSLRHTLARQISMQYENAMHGSDRLDGLKDQLAMALKQNKS